MITNCKAPSYFDIETGPEDDATIRRFMKPFPAYVAPTPFDAVTVKLGARKDPAAIALRIAEASEKHEIDAEESLVEYERKKAAHIANAFANAALNPLTGRIVAIGLRRFGRNRILIAENDVQEKALLVEMLDEAKAHRRQGARIFGFNSGSGSTAGFDLTFIVRRAMKYGLDTSALRQGRSWHPLFGDLLDEFRCGDRNLYVTLDALAKYLGHPGKNGDGAHFADLLKTDRAKAIAYLGNDLCQTEAIAVSMGIPLTMPFDRRRSTFGRILATVSRLLARRFD